MKKFLKNILMMMLSMIAVITVLQLYTESKVQSEYYISIDGNVNKLFLGHSHSECAFNDSIIPNSVNFSNSGDAYMYSYYKLKLILERKNNIDTVFIQFSNNQIESFMTEWTFGNLYMDSKFPNFRSLMNGNTKGTVFLQNPFSYIQSIPVNFKKNSNHILKGNYDITERFGAFKGLEFSKTDSILKAWNVQVPEEESELWTNDISEINLLFLDNIISICKLYHKTVILVRTPFHKEHLGFQIEEKFQKIRNTRYKNEVFFDFSKFKMENKEFGDLDHLNALGAKRFSKHFVNYLSK